MTNVVLSTKFKCFVGVNLMDCVANVINSVNHNIQASAEVGVPIKIRKMLWT